jgi:hypothetical protein
MPPIRFIRAERTSTGSWMTYKLPRPFGPYDDLDGWMAQHLPGWEWASGCYENPDMLAEEETGNSLGEPDVLGPCNDD